VKLYNYELLVLAFAIELKLVGSISLWLKLVGSMCIWCRWEKHIRTTLHMCPQKVNSWPKEMVSVGQELAEMSQVQNLLLNWQIK